MYIDIASPALNIPELTVIPPVVIDMCFPTSDAARIYADVWAFCGTVRTFPLESLILVPVIAPALKLPELSRATIAEPVFAEVALDDTVNVVEPDPL